MVTYAFLREHASSIARAAIVGVVIPGIEVWHFGFYATPELPELLVRGHEASDHAAIETVIPASIAPNQAAGA